jgi:SAM-dependent methyltransferase
MNASVLRRFRRRYLEEHRALGGDSSATLLLHRLMSDAFLGQSGKPSARLRSFLAEFCWRLDDSPSDNALTPTALADLLPLTLNPNASGSHYTSPDVADYVARCTVLPLLLESCDTLITENGDLRSHVLHYIETAPLAAVDGLAQRVRRLRILDPTCGSGAFLLAALRIMWQMQHATDQRLNRGSFPADIVRDNLIGLDLQPEAVKVCRLRLRLELQRLTGCTPAESDNLHCGDALCSDNALSSQLFDAILGNPPYVQLEPNATCLDFETRRCGDLSALIVEQCYRCTQPGARLGLLLPISHFVTDGFAAMQQLTLRSLDRLWVAFFANRPAQLFDGAQKRLALVLGRRGEVKQPAIHTTRYLRWHRHERPRLLERLRFTPTPGFRVLPHSLEKIGSERESRILDKLLPHERLESALVTDSSHVLHYTRKFSYFLEFLDFVPQRTDRRTGHDQQPSELKNLHFRSKQSLHATIAALSSSTFFWFWNAISDGRNVNRRDLLAFPFNPEMVPPSIRRRLAKLGFSYIRQLRSTKWIMRKGSFRIGVSGKV